MSLRWGKLDFKQDKDVWIQKTNKTNTWRPFTTGNCLPFKSLHLTSWISGGLLDAINSLFYSCKEAKIVFFKVLISILKNAFSLKTYSRNHLEIFRNYKEPKGTRMSDWGVLWNITVKSSSWKGDIYLSNSYSIHLFSQQSFLLNLWITLLAGALSSPVTFWQSCKLWR